MKKAKMICATMLSMLLMICLVLPAFAEVDDTDKVDVVDTSKWTVKVNKNAPLSVDQTQQIHEMVEQICPEYADLVDYDTIGNFLQNDQSMTSMQAKHIPEVRIPSVSAVRGLMSTAIVCTETELEDALDDSTITVILLACNIALTQTHEIDHSVVIMALSGTKTITAGYNHFEVNNQSTNIDITFGNVILDGNDVGGGIYIMDSYVTINNAVIQNCNSSSSGTIFASNIKWNSNVGHLVHTGHVTINGGELTDNAASNGAITVAGSLDVNGTDINHNQGRGITVLNISNQIAYVNLSNVKITNNTSTGAGGGIYLFATVTEITGINDYSEISNNISTSGGGGIFSNCAKLFISNSKVNGNKTTGDNGGGIVSYGKLDLTNVEIKNNEADVATGYGAGIYARNIGRPGTSGAYYSGNDEYVTISGCTISGNRGYHTVNEDEEESALYGGGLMIHNILASISNTSITENTANIGGGICALFDDDSNLPETNRADIVLSNVTINENTAHENGGGVILYGDDLSTVSNPAYDFRRISISNSTIYLNNSYNGGGLMIVDSEAICEDDDVVISFNSATNGGGIFIIRNCWIDENYSTSIQEQTDLTGYTITQNAASDNGGGIYFLQHVTVSPEDELSRDVEIQFSLTGGIVSTNTAASNGGGIYITKQVVVDSGYNNSVQITMILSSQQITKNTATIGGGICSACNINLTGGSIFQNRAQGATSYGGGLYIAAQAVVTNTGCSISRNRSENTGGGVFVENGATYSGDTYVTLNTPEDIIRA